jgi:2-polyprenyl-3-methyl-5-hydroxy-6-metoxy-1,4-benzoquinol methylase
MNLLDVVRRVPVPEPYVEGEKIPWDEPEFSRRMLKFHLSQDHDMASRRFSIIDKHVAFIDGLVGGPTRVLDLGCGPGFYVSRFTSLGYKCRGIDFSPASVEYAREQAKEADQEIDYATEDVRKADFWSGYGLVAMVYGEFNVFKRGEMLSIL